MTIFVVKFLALMLLSNVWLSNITNLINGMILIFTVYDAMINFNVLNLLSNLIVKHTKFK